MMKLVFLILMIPVLAQASGKECDLERKKINQEAPHAPRSLSAKETEAFDALHRSLCANLKTPNRFFRGFRAHPGPPYKAAYLWDTAFISQVWMYWDPTIAQELMKYLMRFQKKDGMVKHAVLEIVIKPFAYSNSQPPLLSWATWRIFERSKDLEFLVHMYPKLVRYQNWLRSNRRHSDGLYFWKHPYESGIDNSPRFSNRDESRFEDTTKMAAVDMSSYVALSLEALEMIARELGMELEALDYRHEYESLKVTMNEKLWDHVDQTYYDWDYSKDDFIRMNTISNFTPMVAGVSGPAQSMSLSIRLTDPAQYNTRIPFPSVARNDEHFLKDMWRGPVWINMAYLGVLGLERTGFKAEAAEMARKIVRGVYETYHTEGSFYEFYDPDRYDIRELDRKKGNWWKKLTLGSKPVKDFVGWTGLANTLVFEYGDEWAYPNDLLE
jgi:glycogen debranching enzyme